MKKKRILLSFIILGLLFCCSLYVPIQSVLNIEEQFSTSYEDIENVNKNKTFGSFIKTELIEQEPAVSGQKKTQGEVVFKLFGFVPIKKLSVKLLSDDEYYIGGVPIGICISSDGLIVVSDEKSERSSLKEGDIITEIDGVKVENLAQIQDVLQSCGEETEVKFLRKNRVIKTLVKTVRDEQIGRVKLGFWVKDDVTGVGTLTFVNKNNLKYGALGHPIVESNGGNIVPVSNGKLYQCNLIGINKGKKNLPGELKCVFSSVTNGKGTIENNSKYGISGVLSDKIGLVDENKTAKLGGRLGVKMGNAKIVSSISGIREEYDIEIIKANFQKKADDKSIIFRVKDKRLLSLTGGIVQGMSGSPILQDDKIVGAVTHVFLTDPTKGYAVYSDWMIE